MSFAWPLVLLLAPRALVPLAARAVRPRRSAGARRSSRRSAIPSVLARGSTLGDARTGPAPRLAAGRGALALGLIALARPQLGERQAELARTGPRLLLVLDLSRSMTVPTSRRLGSRRPRRPRGRRSPPLRAIGWGSSCSAAARSSSSRSRPIAPRSGCFSTRPAPTTSPTRPPTSAPRSPPRARCSSTRATAAIARCCW